MNHSIYFVYIVECSDQTLYTGIARDLSARIEEHNSSSKGAKYTSGRRPVTLVYQKQVASRGEALKLEHQLKRLSRSQKNDLIKNQERVTELAE